MTLVIPLSRSLPPVLSLSTIKQAGLTRKVNMCIRAKTMSPQLRVTAMRSRRERHGLSCLQDDAEKVERRLPSCPLGKYH